jgi:amino acid adenylation domain-containing protein
VGYVVMDGEWQVRPLREHLKRRLPAYMIPGEYVQVEEITLTVNGKVDERALRRQGGGRRAESGPAYEAASSEREWQLVAIWQEGLGAERVGVNDNFFDLGGDSIRSLKILSLLSQKCGWRLTLQDLFENPTIRELASIIPDSCGSDTDELTAPFSLISEADRKRLPAGVEDAYPLTRLQAGMLFHSEYSPETAIYHNVSSFHLRAKWELEKFQIAVQRLIARHPVLRTSFDLTSFSQPLQLVHREFDCEIQVDDLCHLLASEQEREAGARFENQKRLKFDWAKAPLLRFYIQLRSQETFQFTLVEHHAILDGWSVALLLSELFRTYLSLLDEKFDAVEPDLKVRFRDFVALERKATESEKDRAFWAYKLSTASIAPMPRLPERKRAGEARKIIAQEVSISEEISHGLRQLSSSAGTPLKSVLLAAHLKVISFLSSQRSITTGLVCNGRPETHDGERVLGLFLNTLPLSFNLDSGTWIELARRTFQAELELLPHRRFPLADLQKMAGGELLFETAFNFVHFHTYSDLLRMGTIRLLGEATYEETNFTLLANFSVDAESLQPHLQLVFDITELTDEQVSNIAGYYSNTLAAMASDPFGGYEHDSPISPRELTQLQEWTKVNGKMDGAGRRRGGRRAKSGAAYEQASGEQQQRMVEIWEEVLGAERVGINDNFFDLGGDSIRAIQVSAKSRLNGLNVTVQQLFKCGTIRELTNQNLSQQSELPPPLTVQPFSLISEADRKRLPAGVEDAYPLTRLQAGMLFHSLYDDGGSTYHNVSSIRLQVDLNIHCLRSALNHLGSRHPALRTSVDLHGFSEPLQLIHREGSIPLQVEDLRQLSSFQQEQTLSLFFQGEKKSKFDWTKAPLLRFHVHQLTDQTIQFSWAEHHAILDGWSVASMLTELFQTYNDLLNQRPCEREALPAIAFRDFIAMERQALESEESRIFWADNLRDGTITLLPRWSSPGRPLGERRGLKQVHRVIDVSEGLKLLARSAAVPLKSVLLAAHLRVLSFLSGQLDVITGLVSNSRPEENGGERVLGLFLNTLPFRLELSGGTWLQLAQEVFAAEQGLLPFRHYPLTQIQAITGGQPLFETIFNFVHFHVYDRLAKAAGLKILGEESFIETNFTFEADFILDTALSNVHLILKYNSSELIDEQVRSICGYYERTFEAMAKAPLESYEAHTLLSDLELRQLLIDWNSAQTSHPVAHSIIQLFEIQVENAPDAVALVDGESRLTYRELNGRANKLAHYLQSIGVGPERIVGIYMQRSSEMLVAVLGILKTGGVYLPLDPAYPKERLAFMIRDARAHVLLTQAQLVESLAGVEARVVCMDADSQAIGKESNEELVIELTEDSLIYLIYTSGSTGKPKAVAMNHGSLLNLIYWQIESLPGPSKTLQFASLSFDVSFQEIFSTWCSGGTLVLVSEQRRRDAREVLQIIEIESVESVFIPFVVLQQMAGLVEAGAPVPGSLRRVITAGEQLKITPQVASLFNKLECSLHNHYGPSESHVVTAFTLAGTPGLWPSLPPIGKPISNTQIYLLDEHQQPVPIGATGELHIGGRSLARGYWERAELTAEKFIPNPFASSAGSRLYKTGDLARYLPDGNLEFLGRADNQVKWRGYRIELGEIEAALVEHASLRQSAVAMHENVDGEKTLVAYIVSHDGATPTTSELRMALMKKLPDYMVPALFVSLDQLPLTPSGKVERKSLPAPPRVRPMIERPYVRPRRPIEQIMAEIWAEVLRVDRVGIHDDFFELGGHSLSAIQLISRVRHRFDTELSLRRLFKNPTIAELSRVIEKELLEKVESMTEADARKILKKLHESTARGE